MLDPELKSTLDGLNSSLDGITGKFNNLQKQIDAVELSMAKRLVGGINQESAIKLAFDESNISSLIKDRRGTGVVVFKEAAIREMERKQVTEIGLGYQQTGVVPLERTPGIVPEARQVLRVRDVLSSSPTQMAVVDFVKVTQPPAIASPIPEASTKPQTDLVLTAYSEKIRTLAVWLAASKQLLDDMGELMGYIQNSLPYYTNLSEETELLSGDGTGEHLHGLLVQSAPLDTSLLPSSGATKIDAIGCAISQITNMKELPPTFAILNTADYWSMRLSKDSLGRYLIADPQQVMTPTLFGLQLVPTTSIAKGTFLVGSGSPIASEIRDRMEVQVEISTEHMDYFIKNLIAIRAEKRLALLVKRPNSYVTGSFTGLSLASSSASR